MRTIPEYPDYKINIDGQIFNKDGKEMKTVVHKSGYKRLQLSKNKKAKTLLVHRLVAQAFLPNFYGKSQVDHKNRNRSDNRLINLHWVTHQENQQNRSIAKNNTSGHKYVSYHKSRKRWRFQKTINKKLYTKYFKTIEEAIDYKELFGSGSAEYHQR